MTIIERDELRALLTAGAPIALLEALPERFFRDGHLPGAKLFPHNEARALAAELLPDKAQRVVLYCSNGDCRNSHTAAAVLAGLGYENVSVYAAGKADWIAAGLPLERDATAG